jgi:hypothetical protein
MSRLARDAIITTVMLRSGTNTAVLGILPPKKAALTPGDILSNELKLHMECPAFNDFCYKYELDPVVHAVPLHCRQGTPFDISTSIIQKMAQNWNNCLTVLSFNKSIHNAQPVKANQKSYCTAKSLSYLGIVSSCPTLIPN